MSSAPPRVVVIGGGIAGLAAAYRLTLLAPSVSITLLEAGDRLGGKIITEYRDGFVIEGGPDSFLSAKPGGIGLCQELGIDDQLQGTTPRRHRAFVSHHGRLHPLPEGLTGLVPTRLGPIARGSLLSSRGKARLALDYLLPARPDDDDESLASFVRRRLGTETYDQLVEPLMAGIYAGDGERLSLAATFPQLRQAERTHGGLIRGVLAATRERQRTPAVDGAPARPAFVTPRQGLAVLVTALATAITRSGAEIKTATPVEGIRPGEPASDGRYRVALGNGGWLDVEAVVLATPAPVTAHLVRDLDPPLAETIRAIPHASSAIVTLAYPAATFPRPLEGHGYVIPRVERRPALACTWSSAKWEGRAPDGHVLLRVFIGRFGQEAALAGSDDDLRRLARAELRQILGVTAAPVFSLVHRWPAGMPQYTLGHLDRLATIDNRLDGLPGLTVAGNAYRGVGLPDCIASGEQAATTAHAAATARGSKPPR